MVVGLANSTSIARLSAVSNYVNPSTASGSPPFSRKDICSHPIVNSISSKKCSPRQTVIIMAHRCEILNDCVIIKEESRVIR